jgi:hypothetical protein
MIDQINIIIQMIKNTKEDHDLNQDPILDPGEKDTINLVEDIPIEINQDLIQSLLKSHIRDLDQIRKILSIEAMKRNQEIIQLKKYLKMSQMIITTTNVIKICKIIKILFKML